MWLERRLASGEGAELPFFGRVTAMRGNRAEISAGMQLGEVVCVCPFGSSGLPAVGDSVLVLPVRLQMGETGMTTRVILQEVTGDVA